MDWSLSIFSWKAFPTGIGPSLKTNALRTSPFFLHAVRPSLLSAMLLPWHVWNLLYLVSLSAVLSASMVLKPSPTSTYYLFAAESERRGCKSHAGPLRIHGKIPDYIMHYHIGVLYKSVCFTVFLRWIVTAVCAVTPSRATKCWHRHPPNQQPSLLGQCCCRRWIRHWFCHQFRHCFLRQHQDTDHMSSRIVQRKEWCQSGSLVSPECCEHGCSWLQATSLCIINANWYNPSVGHLLLTLQAEHHSDIGLAAQQSMANLQRQNWAELSMTSFKIL